MYMSTKRSLDNPDSNNNHDPNNRYRLNEKGDVISALIVFPILVIMIYMVLQIWFWSSARTTAQIAADEALRSAQDAAAITENDTNVARAGVGGALGELDNPGSFIVPAKNYVACETTFPSVSASNHVGASCESDSLPEVCDAKNPLIEVGVDDDQIVTCVNAYVYVPFISLTGGQVATSACGPRDLSSWAPNRLLTNIEDSSDSWGDSWSC